MGFVFVNTPIAVFEIDTELRFLEINTRKLASFGVAKGTYVSNVAPLQAVEATLDVKDLSKLCADTHGSPKKMTLKHNRTIEPIFSPKKKGTPNTSISRRQALLRNYTIEQSIRLLS